MVADYNRFGLSSEIRKALSVMLTRAGVRV